MERLPKKSRVDRWLDPAIGWLVSIGIHAINTMTLEIYYRFANVFGGSAAQR